MKWQDRWQIEFGFGLYKYLFPLFSFPEISPSQLLMVGCNKLETSMFVSIQEAERSTLRRRGDGDIYICNLNGALLMNYWMDLSSSTREWMNLFFWFPQEANITCDDLLNSWILSTIWCYLRYYNLCKSLFVGCFLYSFFFFFNFLKRRKRGSMSNSYFTFTTCSYVHLIWIEQVSV